MKDRLEDYSFEDLKELEREIREKKRELRKNESLEVGKVVVNKDIYNGQCWRVALAMPFTRDDCKMRLFTMIRADRKEDLIKPTRKLIENLQEVLREMEHRWK